MEDGEGDVVSGGGVVRGGLIEKDHAVVRLRWSGLLKSLFQDWFIINTRYLHIPSQLSLTSTESKVTTPLPNHNTDMCVCEWSRFITQRSNHPNHL